jgi:hypothetical protein
MSNAEKIAELRKEADALEAADNNFRALPEDERLAITLHSMLCHANHTDGCSWGYEESGDKTEWNGYAHKRYLEKSRRVLVFTHSQSITVDSVIELINLVKE